MSSRHRTNPKAHGRLSVDPAPDAHHRPPGDQDLREERGETPRLQAPRRFVDLHTHSTASDGGLDPAEVIRLADQARLGAVALTDHDTVDGLDEARRAATQCPNLVFVPGIEISACFPRGTLHLLGLGIDPASDTLSAALETLQAARAERNPRMLKRLGELGMPLDMEDVLAAAGPAPAGQRHVVSRAHIAEAMRRKGYVSDLRQAFARWIGQGKPAYFDKERLAPAQAIGAIRRAGGLAILAHPVHLQLDNRLQLERVVRDLAGHGLDGIEVYHSDHSDALTRICLDLARRLGLAVTGGSDFHGPPKPHVRLGHPRVPLAALGQAVHQLIRRP